MSFGGTVLGMIVSLKNNSNLLAKRRTYKDLSTEYKYRLGEPLKYKELSESELSELKSKIRRDFARQRKLFVLKSMILIVAIISIGAVVLGIVGENYLKKTQDDENELKYILENTKYGSEAYQNKAMFFYLNNGYTFFSQGKFREAKYYFRKAYKFGETDFRVIYANAMIEVYDCIYNKVDCEETVIMLKKLRIDYGLEPKVKDLIDFYNENKKKQQYEN